MRLRNAATYYLISSAVQRGAGVVVLVLLAREMSLKQYGFVVLLSATYPLLAVLAGVGAEIPLSRAASAKDATAERDLVFGLRLLSAATLIPVVGAIALAAVLSGPHLLIAVLLEATSASLFSGCLWPLVVNARARGQVHRAAVLATVFIVVPQLLRALAVSAHHTAFVYSCAGAAAHVLLVAAWRCWPVLARSGLASLLVGLPFLPHVLAHWVMSLSDRLLVGAILGASAVAVYGPNYQIVALIGLTFVEVNRVLIPVFGDRQQDGSLLLRLGEWSLAAQITFTLAAIAVLPFLVPVLLPASLQLGTSRLAILALGQLAYGCYLLAANELTLRRGDRGLAFISGGAALLNILINLALLPMLGLSGAVFATTLAYAALAAGAIWRVASAPLHPTVPTRALAFVTGACVIASSVLAST
jgi:O-antigen/teichoic acid export membrane protein